MAIINFTLVLNITPWLVAHQPLVSILFSKHIILFSGWCATNHGDQKHLVAIVNFTLVLNITQTDKTKIRKLRQPIY